MPTKSIPQAVLNKRDAAETERLAVATAAALGAILKPILEQLASDKQDRHQVANTAETASLKAYEAMEIAKVNESRLNGMEKRMDSLMGDGTGRNGAIAEMDRNIGEVKGDVRDMKSQMDTMSKKLDKVLDSSEKSQSFMSGWGGVKTALALIGTLVAIIIGLATMAHMK